MPVSETDELRFRVQDYWEGVFSEENPWSYDTEYEQKKYEQTLSLLPSETLSRAAELACAEGHFTVRLAPLVGHLFASDISPRALERARVRCRGVDNVEFAVLDILTGCLPQDLDLVVCSEVLYYLPLDVLPSVASRLSNQLRAGGYLLSAHPNALADDRTRTGFDWNHKFGAKTIGQVFGACGQLALLKELRTPLYSIQLYRRVSGAGDAIPVPQIVDRPIETPLSVRVEKTIGWDGAVMTRSEARERETASHVPILAYHSIADTGPEALSAYRVSVEAFRQQLRYLRRHGFYSISLEEWVASIDAQRPLPGRPVIITFDDGYRDFLDNAWPLLERADFRATVFVVTDHVGGRAEWDRNLAGSEPLPLMTWDELRMLRDTGIDIQSHTASHPDLLTLTGDEILYEANKARRTIREHLGFEATCIAFPYGRTNLDIAATFSRCGYQLGLNTIGEVSTLGDDSMDLPRIQIDPSDEIDSFARKISGPAALNGNLHSGSVANTLAVGIPDATLAARLDKLIGEFVSLQMQVLNSTTSEAPLQRRFRMLFSKPLLSQTSELLQPYREISPGICIGFEEPARVHFQVDYKRDHSVSPESFLNTIGLNFRTPSRWFSIEVLLDWQELSSARHFQISVYAEPSRPLPCWAVVRIPKRSGGFTDSHFAQFDLSPSLKHANRSGKLDLPDLLDIDTTKNARLLLFFDSKSDLSIKLNYLNCYFC